MAYSVSDLPYDFGALEPHIDARTMEIHHDKHHAAYVTNLNAALEGTEWMDRPIDAVLANLEISPRGQAHGRPQQRRRACEPLALLGDHERERRRRAIGALADAIADTFGSLDELKTLVNDAGVKRFGSGWTWLVWDGTGLAVYSTANQDSPVMQSDVPLLGIDVWEHAYYLNYQNRRPDYLAAWWNVVDWDAVAARYEQR